MEEMFVGSTPEEVERQTTQYRDLLTQAEGPFSWKARVVRIADDVETKTDLANRSFKDIRSAVLSGEALFKTSMCFSKQARRGLTSSKGYRCSIAGC